MDEQQYFYQVDTDGNMFPIGWMTYEQALTYTTDDTSVMTREDILEATGG